MINYRILKVELEVNNQVRVYEDLQISARGTKLSNHQPNDFEIKITNLSNETRQALLSDIEATKKSPKKRKIIFSIGRIKDGVNRLFIGDIKNVTVSQPPDIVTTITAVTSFANTFDITSRSGGETIKLSILARQIASKLGLELVFEATDKMVGSYTYTGSSLKEVQKLGEVGQVAAYIDDDKLIVRNINEPLKNSAFYMDKDNGLIKVEPNEKGCVARCYYNYNVKIGSQFELKSELLPNLNGNWVVYKIDYELANRSENCFMNLELIRG